MWYVVRGYQTTGFLYVLPTTLGRLARLDRSCRAVRISSNDGGKKRSIGATLVGRLVVKEQVKARHLGRCSLGCFLRTETLLIADRSSCCSQSRELEKRESKLKTSHRLPARLLQMQAEDPCRNWEGYQTLRCCISDFVGNNARSLLCDF